MILATELVLPSTSIGKKSDNDTIICLYHEVRSQKIFSLDSKAMDDNVYFLFGDNVSSFCIIELPTFIGDKVAFLNKDSPKSKVRCISLFQKV